MENPLLGIGDKVAVVAGGGEGMGRATSVLLAKAGVCVVIGDIDEGRAAATQREIEQAGGKACAVRADTRLEEDVDLLVRTALERYGRIDIDVNIVGGHAHYAPAIDTREGLRRTADASSFVCLYRWPPLPHSF